MKTVISTNTMCFYQSTKRNNNIPLEVWVLEIKGKSAIVRSQGQLKVNFKCRLSSLYN